MSFMRGALRTAPFFDAFEIDMNVRKKTRKIGKGLFRHLLFQGRRMAMIYLRKFFSPVYAWFTSETGIRSLVIFNDFHEKVFFLMSGKTECQ